jgi:hypothetical protein
MPEGPTPVASIGGPRGRRGQATTDSGRERRHDNTLGHDAKFYVIKRSTAAGPPGSPILDEINSSAYEGRS